MLRFTLLAAALLAALSVIGCAGGTPGISDNDMDTGFHAVVNPLPSADGDFGFSDTDEKAASAAFRYFFHDAVNQHSGGRWTTENQSGKKSWTLSNVFFTDPKAWQLGGNYWNNEADVLTSNGGSVPGDVRGIKLGYHGRWRIAEGDGCSVQYSVDGFPWTEIAFFTAGQNPSFPEWDRYTFALPDSAPFSQTYQVRFVFTSNGSITDMGYGVDRVAIYQTLLTAPAFIEPSKENMGELSVFVEHNLTGERPSNYDVYRSDTGEFGEYVVVGNTPYPGTMFNTTWIDETAAPFTEYWYMLRSTKPGWDDSAFSAADFGTYWLDQGD
jgi:hypothetical protein